jgi:DNA-binding MarR family transcriptional regulator
VTTPKLDELIHAPTRLSMMALLAASQWAEFSYVRDELGVSDSVMSKQASLLESAGYVKVKKGYVGKRPRTWLQITKSGRQAFDSHVAALKQIVARADIPSVTSTPSAMEPN